MKIYSMTATFGKLEHETLTLQPGLNIIEAPNEWGKSTWCAFLVNMFYGIDTRARTTKDVLADKERYAPWSGAPMSGRIDLNWNGRDITIQRATKGRLVFGDFRAYETDTGLDIPELNAANCGQLLLGVERSVFVRAGFLKLSDLPLTQDDALRRRLNDLVTTGDESGAADKLAETLKKLKNSCRHNRTGELPKAEAQRDALLTQLHDLNSYQDKADALRARQAELSRYLKALGNHRKALLYTASLESQQKIAACEEQVQQLSQAVQLLEEDCKKLSSPERLQALLTQTEQLQQQLTALKWQPKPEMPEAPAIPARYADCAPEEAPAMAARDHARLLALQGKSKKRTLWMTILLIAAAVCGLSAVFAGVLWPAMAGFAGSLVVSAVLTALIGRGKDRQALDDLKIRYESLDAAKWAEDAQTFAREQAIYAAAMEQLRAQQAQLDENRQELEQQAHELTGGKPLNEARTQWQQGLNAHAELAAKRQSLAHAQAHADDVRSMAKEAPAPTEPDTLEISLEKTEELLNKGQFEQQQMHQELGRIMGQTDALGQEGPLKARLETLSRRIARLEDTYYALEMAQDALHAATAELQRRFAPRISKRAQELFSQLTGGRYRELSMSADMSLNTAAEHEDVQRPSQWRSDGTIDQLYLALRLAVAEELTPHAPIVLDDALVRFDDTRLKEAMALLKAAAEQKQVILFTCQSREQALS